MEFTMKRINLMSKISLLFLVLPTLFGISSCRTNKESSNSSESVSGLASTQQKKWSPVEKHGALRVAGNKIVDKNNKPVQLKGMSLFWSQWAPEFWNSGVVATLSNDWQSTVVRAAMGVNEQGSGYMFNKTLEKDKVKRVVDAAIKQGIYVIIDWHDHHAENRVDEAVAFFSEMAQIYGKYPNVLFEIYNEPLGIQWKTIKSYAVPVINAIRAKGARNIILVGTPLWSQDVDIAAEDPLKFENIAYTLHFYAASHRQELRDKALKALNKGIALFVTEWGTCDYSGNGYVDLEESRKWIEFMAQHQISWANWSLHDKKESASAIKETSPRKTQGRWTEEDLTESGKFIRSAIRARN
jgi:endoglucanase